MLVKMDFVVENTLDSAALMRVPNQRAILMSCRAVDLLHALTLSMIFGEA